MATGWLSLLKHVPWSEVINSAPQLADSARKLWGAVDKRPIQDEHADVGTYSSASPQETMAVLEARVVALDESVAQLHTQMRASSELIKALADQNAQLIQRIETNRVRLIWLSAATAVFGLTSVIALVLALTRSA
ncbi:hypothetical protein [Noviherbaspirillum saxi]|uniref:Uncharacterized protein n=1 Tax=Noviherbaspirillum saxi TaxID=2320863 RepID=A0A3A3FIV4_9BURK|nr:hypothetical protein [Noviherbaspirillum saxi]RJF95184.1 hypothetical protein D3871_17175 [Noviherbaspirillum saxi]